jgi:hypothetical protein
MEIIAIPPMTPAAMTPAWPAFEDGRGTMVESTLVEDVFAVDVLVGDVFAVNVLVGDVYTPEGPKIVPGPYSGLSISNVGVRP